ncbi:MAG: hypothetical protein WBO36_07150, partial [Saprospiraceae bacterium]
LPYSAIKWDLLSSIACLSLLQSSFRPTNMITYFEIKTHVLSEIYSFLYTFRSVATTICG